MEIEAKYALPDEETFESLATRQTLGGFALGPARTVVHRDTYFDTPGRRILQAGYSCRVRLRDEESHLLTVKSLPTGAEVSGDDGENAALRREELEESLPGLSDEAALEAANWPEGPIRERVRSLAGDDPLVPLLSLEQERTVRYVAAAGRVVAELSLDRVVVHGGRSGPEQSYLEAEVEHKAGDEADFGVLVRALAEGLGLQGEGRSKFERGLALVDASTNGLLTPEELRIARRLARRSDRFGRRARALLALHEGATQADAGRRAGFSSRQVRTWLSAFRRRRLAIFPEVVLGSAGAGDEAAVPADAPGESVAPAESDAPAEIETLVADVLAALEAPGPGAIPAEGPHFEETGAATAEAAPPAAPPAMVVTEAQDEPVRESGPEPPDEAADEASGEPRAAADEGEPAPEPRRERSARRKPGVAPDDTMAEAADKILLFHLDRMMDHEAGTRLGEDIEELHDMRVATRRMRAALRLFSPFLDEESVKPYLKGLRRTGRTLGAVRDLDVFWEKTEHYLGTLPAERRDELEPLRAVWAEERDRKREAMIDYLDSGKYRRFKEGFEEFLVTPGAGEMPPFLPGGGVRPRRVRDLVPQVVYAHAAEVWAYEEWLHTEEPPPLERFHRLRIAAKGLRYTLEFFSEVLGREAKQVISPIKRLQDHLGDLNDATVSCGVLRDFLTWGTWGGSEGAKRRRASDQIVVAPGVAAYLAARQDELAYLVATFPEVWPEVGDSAYRERLAELLGGL